MGRRHTTHHDQWYTLEKLVLSLRPQVQVRQQVIGGETWYVVSDPANNTHFRLARPAYAFLAFLDGKKTVQEAWENSSEMLDEHLLTQSEVIQLLGKLHTSNLLQSSQAVNTESVLRRRQNRRLKKVSQTLSSFMFLRIPLLSPDAFFSRYAGIGTFLFSPVGRILWLVMALLALYHVVLDWGTFSYEARSSLAAANMPWLYLMMLLTKFVHETGHGFACKYFSTRDGLKGHVSVLGVMFLLFVPVPYVDVSSSVQVRSKWARSMVALGGVYHELFLAFVATLLWAYTLPDTTLHILARNCMVIASVTTLLFNANPLMRFDGYFALADFIEMPNLYQRSQAFGIYLFKRYVLGVQQADTPVESRREKIFYPVYATAAFVYRMLIVGGIYFVLKNTFYALGVILAAGLFFLWFGWPLLKGLKYLWSSFELAGNRSKVLARFLALVFVAVVVLLLIPVEHAIVTNAVVESRSQHIIYAATEGNLTEFLATDTKVQKDASQLVNISNPGQDATLEKLGYSLQVLEARYKYALHSNDANAAGFVRTEYLSTREQWDLISAQAANQKITAPADGVWIAPNLGRRLGKWVDKGDQLGVIFDPRDLRLRLAVGQLDAARLFAEPVGRASFRILGWSGYSLGRSEWEASVELAPLPAGKQTLFHPSLAQSAGGHLALDPQRSDAAKTMKPFFELSLLPEEDSLPYLLPGQRVRVRLVLDKSPLGLQWFHRVQQFFLSR